MRCEYYVLARQRSRDLVQSLAAVYRCEKIGAQITQRLLIPVGGEGAAHCRG